VGGLMAEQVRVEVRDASLAAPALDHLGDAGGGQAALRPEPQPGQRDVGVLGPGPEVAIERSVALEADVAQALAAVLALADPADPIADVVALWVRRLGAEVGELGEAPAAGASFRSGGPLSGRRPGRGREGSEANQSCAVGHAVRRDVSGPLSANWPGCGRWRGRRGGEGADT
jgi:hypothetical protein